MVGHVCENWADALEVAEPEIEQGTKPLPLYKVLLHNDEDTPMQFVTQILRGVFAKPLAEARAIMMEAHEQGVALVEIVPFEHAELHVDRTKSLARARGYPLALSIEPAD